MLEITLFHYILISFLSQQSEYGSIRHKKVPRRRSSNESESKTRANFERVSRTHFSEKDTTRKSASRKRSHEKDASYESAPRKRSSEKSASQKQSSTKNATRKRRFSRSKSPDNALERTQHKKAKCGTSSCEGQKAKVKDSERSRHAQFVKNQGTSQDPQVIMSKYEFIMLHQKLILLLEMFLHELHVQCKKILKPIFTF